MKPYLSIVATSRNDNHGDEMFQRMNLFVSGLIYQFNKYKVYAELVLVEWNPLPNLKQLHEVLPKPKPGDFLSIRYITVPAQIHNQYRFANQLGLYQMIAKNVGIRRAKGDFILCTNVDLIFSDPLMESIAQKKFEKDKFYRANRVDVPKQVLKQDNFEKQLTYAQSNAIRVLGKNVTCPNPSNFLPSWLCSTAMAWILNFWSVCFKQLRNAEQVAIEELDTVACGDFTLMHRDAWIDIQGYPELDFYSIHIDTMALVAAAALGYKQVTFPPAACTYHIDHANGWETLTATEKIKFIHTKPGIGLDIVTEAGKEMIRNKTKFNFNKPDWGYTSYTFTEVNLNPYE